MNINTLLHLVGICLLWGLTNPFLKTGSAGIENVRGGGLAKLKFLLFSWKWLVPFLVNQMGAFLFYALLSAEDMTLVVPAANVLTLVVTGMTGHLLGERLTKGALLGILIMMAGVAICMYDNYRNTVINAP
ncbi:transmembrane protein 234 homolog [Oscarella lobularis]|uniref:transmembrane protein 234 homolog n=1 Tax=Oscarella lobularis TaxID=121494 RepID=UPI003313F304